jgi:hypothetical protein
LFVVVAGGGDGAAVVVVVGGVVVVAVVVLAATNRFITCLASLPCVSLSASSSLSLVSRACHGLVCGFSDGTLSVWLRFPIKNSTNNSNNNNNNNNSHASQQQQPSNFAGKLCQASLS